MQTTFKLTTEIANQLANNNVAIALMNVTPAFAGEVVKHRNSEERQKAKWVNYEFNRTVDNAHIKALAANINSISQGSNIVLFGVLNYGTKKEQYVLLDGQHRLHAVAEYGHDVELPVLFRKMNETAELDERYNSIDSDGRKRGVSDLIRSYHLTEELVLPSSYITQVFAAIRLIVRGFDRHVNKKGLVSSVTQRLQAIRYWAEYAKRYYAIVSACEDKVIRRVLLSSPCIAVGMVTLKFAPDRIDFWHQLVDNCRNNGALAVLVESFRDQRSMYYRMGNGEDKCRLISEAWNAYHRGIAYSPSGLMHRHIEIYGTGHYNANQSYYCGWGGEFSEDPLVDFAK